MSIRLTGHDDGQSQGTPGQRRALTLRIERGAAEGELRIVAEGFDPISVTAPDRILLRPALEGHGVVIEQDNADPLEARRLPTVNDAYSRFIQMAQPKLSNPRRKPMNKFATALTITTALLAGGTLMSGRAEAVPLGDPNALRSAAGYVDPLENVQVFYWHGRRYCWYDDAWNGPGWYWCGYAWRWNLGWGGGFGWHGWRGGHRGKHHDHIGKPHDGKQQHIGKQHQFKPSGSSFKPSGGGGGLKPSGGGGHRGGKH